jgi:hypothetical protein
MINIIIIACIGIVIIARIFFPFTPIWLDAIFIAAALIVLIYSKKDKVNHKDSKDQST